NPCNVVIIDEAYVDFGGESAVSLVRTYDNLFVVGTFSKSRSMAGVRLGFGIASPSLIADVNTVRYATNPYNVNRLTAAAGTAALKEKRYYDANCQIIMQNREWTAKALSAMGFEVIPSKANFLFARSPDVCGETLYLKLKEKGVLVRHFAKERIKDFVRITVGTEEEMRVLTDKIKEILEEKGV
ncbi:MAG: aminotransferase class I/II-fold pyridoxal phosphate-dependent enzyme, partial [Clostridia bacterium]|nr:aminotransferase class I/II-fold pyridoxal phosphate-dependent enzyme [Clostridia bacterium]